MPDPVDDQVAEGVDFALVAYREDGRWQVDRIPAERLHDVEALAAELRRWPGETGSLGLVSFDEDFFVLVRVAGREARVLLSDVTAATEWAFARSALEHLGIPVPDDDEDDPEPAGDIGMLADLGFSAMAFGALLDEDLYPEETLGEIAAELGFGALYDDAVGVPAP